MDRVTVALIGNGYWGSKLKRYIEANENFDLKCICDSKSNLYKEVWEDNSIEAVVIATPNSTHFELVREALFFKKHVMVEKPLALETKECEYLQLYASEQGKVLLTEYTYTFSRALEEAVEMINDGSMGDLVAVDMAIKHLGRFGGGSVYWLLGSHMLSVLDMFHPIKKLKFERKDIFVNEGMVESGIILFYGAIRGQISLSLNYPWKESYVVLYCKNGTIKYNPDEQVPLLFTMYSRADWTEADKLIKIPGIYEIDEKNNLGLAIKEFYNCIRNGKEDNATRAVEITRILETM